MKISHRGINLLTNVLSFSSRDNSYDRIQAPETWKYGKSVALFGPTRAAIVISAEYGLIITMTRSIAPIVQIP